MTVAEADIFRFDHRTVLQGNPALGMHGRALGMQSGKTHQADEYESGNMNKSTG